MRHFHRSRHGADCISFRVPAEEHFGRDLNRVRVERLGRRKCGRAIEEGTESLTGPIFGKEYDERFVEHCGCGGPTSFF